MKRNQKLWDAAIAWSLAVQEAPGSRQSGRAFWGRVLWKYKELSARAGER